MAAMIARFRLGTAPWATLPLMAVAILALSGCQTGPAKPTADPNRKVKITTTQEGTGDLRVQNGDSVWVMYSGRITKTGVQFDANTDDPTNSEPFQLFMGMGMVIKGWEEGLLGARIGEKRTLEIPWEKGYGENGSGEVIKPFDDLTFDVEVVYITRKGQDEIWDLISETKGTGPAAKPGDQVSIHYKGTYLSGKLWDDTRARGKTADFKLGDRTRVIPGINAAVDGMQVGGKRTVILPPSLVFGLTGNQYITGNQPVKIEIELVSLNGRK